jgi:rhodanese-related sulfurtransferase
VPEVAPDVLIEQIRSGRAPLILDVRSTREFDDGHVPGAVHIPFWQVGRRWQAFASARELPVVVYCGHGPRAYMAGSALRRRGFTNVIYLAGHMKKWKDLNLPLERK